MSTYTQMPQAPTLPGYTWIRHMGSGGFAQVHVYRQNALGRDVAVKFMNPHLQGAYDSVLEREGRAMAAVSGHSSLVGLVELVRSAEGLPGLVMEYCPQGTLADYCSVQPMSMERALDTMIRVSAGVEMLHRAGFVHRDIKPRNVFIDAYSMPRLGDFGMVVESGTQAPAGTDGVSLLWGSPELHVPNSVAHPRMDVWGLAVTTWALLTCRSPFEDPVGDNSQMAISMRIQQGILPSLTAWNYPLDLERVLRQALTLDSRTRIQSAYEFAMALRGVQQSLGLPQTPIEVSGAQMGTSAAMLPSQQYGTLPGQPHSQPVPPHAHTAQPAAPLQTENMLGYGGEEQDPDVTRVRHYRMIEEESDQQPVAPPPNPQTETPRAEAPSEQTIKKSAFFSLIIIGIAVGVVAVALILTAFFGGWHWNATSGTTHDPLKVTPVGEDAIALVPDAPENLEAKIVDDRIVWTWQHQSSTSEKASNQQSSAQSGAQSKDKNTRFVYEVTRPDQDPLVGTTALKAFDSPATTGENCIEVVARGVDGASSEPAKLCVTVP